MKEQTSHVLITNVYDTMLKFYTPKYIIFWSIQNIFLNTKINAINFP